MAVAELTPRIERMRMGTWVPSPECARQTRVKRDERRWAVRSRGLYWAILNTGCCAGSLFIPLPPRISPFPPEGSLRFGAVLGTPLWEPSFHHHQQHRRSRCPTAPLLSQTMTKMLRCACSSMVLRRRLPVGLSVSRNFETTDDRACYSWPLTSRGVALCAACCGPQLHGSRFDPRPNHADLSDRPFQSKSSLRSTLLTHDLLGGPPVQSDALRRVSALDGERSQHCTLYHERV